MPASLSDRRARSSSVIDILIVCVLLLSGLRCGTRWWCALGVLLEERFVLVDRTDFIARLSQRRCIGAALVRDGGPSLQDALERLVGGRCEREHLLARGLDVLARVMAREI